MFAGHLGFALGTYSFRRTIPLWLLLIAAQLPDWLDAGACFADVNRGPAGLYTHGVYAIGIAALLLAIGYVLVTRDAIGCLLVALTVISHYGLDYLTGIKPTWPGGPMIGLELYNRPLIDLIMESGVILLGWWLYRRTIRQELRDAARVYLLLFGLLAYQVVAGLAFVFNIGGQMKC
jgi:hypothetical protein